MENGRNGGGWGFARPHLTRHRELKPPFLPQGKSRAALPEKEVMQVSPVPAQPPRQGPTRPGQSWQDRAPCAARALGRRPHSTCGGAGKGRSTWGPTLLLWARNARARAMAALLLQQAPQSSRRRAGKSEGPGEWDCRAQG